MLLAIILVIVILTLVLVLVYASSGFVAEAFERGLEQWGDDAR